ncbi:MAG: M18 family aminopeptidase [Megasphaera sp.]|jgi:aspartyl aminopeptidase|nr:M18 family aminopeptidase [Megasphaera sp.]MCH4187394.1 M18 family aminopeptidase [Megasphaera sp.]MCH4217576.1 M18 family aminopeptidase [Megasphaera sp.]
MEDTKTIDELLRFLKVGTSPYQVVQESAAILRSAGFQELKQDLPWELAPGKAYYTIVYGSALVAFRIGDRPEGTLRLATAHTDFPCLRVKPAASVVTKGYGKVNVEVYGGMIRDTWLDRPLSLAGKLVLKGTDPFHPVVHLVDAKRPVMTIPHLAIHMNREVNNGVVLNPQKDMLPLLTMMGEQVQQDFFDEFLAAEFHCAKDDILSYELTVYPWEEPCRFGFHNEFISSPRLDNLTSVKACLDGIVAGQRQDGISMIALFDNEEVGSTTKQGAASLVLPQLVQRMYHVLGYDMEMALRKAASGFFLSLDVAHAMHPNVPEKNDITNIPVLNGGVTLKIACSQAYAGDAEAVGIVTALCQQGEIPYQYFVNRSDIRGGSTLGSLLSANLPMRAMDIGVPIVAMHSARETMGANDQWAITELVRAFFC